MCQPDQQHGYVTDLSGPFVRGDWVGEVINTHAWTKGLIIWDKSIVLFFRLGGPLMTLSFLHFFRENGSGYLPTVARVHWIGSLHGWMGRRGTEESITSHLLAFVSLGLQLRYRSGCVYYVPHLADDQSLVERRGRCTWGR